METETNIPVFQKLDPQLTPGLGFFLYNGDVFYQIGPKRFVVGSTRSYTNFSLKNDDVFVNSLPRSGTTWTQEMVWLIKMDMNFERAKKEYLDDRFPCLNTVIEPTTKLYQSLLEVNKDDTNNLSLMKRRYGQDRVQMLAETPSPRFIQTHLPMSLLPPNLLDVAKVLYVMRDPRDTMVSHYYLYQLIKFVQFKEDFKTFWRLYINGLVPFGPYFEHVKEAWRMKDHPNILILSYEEMLEDLPSVVRRVAKFFNKVYTDEQYEKLCQHLNFDQFKKNPSVNSKLKSLGLHVNEKGNDFVRKGKSGGWRDYFDEEMTQITQQWIDDNLRDTDLRTCYTFQKIV